MHEWRDLLAGSALLVVVLAGCGGGSDEGTGATGPTITPAATASPDASASPVVPASSAAPSPAGPSPTPRDRIVYDRSADESLSFVTPSGNIHCEV